MKKTLQSKNNRLIIILIFLCQGLFSQTIEKLYINMPDNLNPILSRQNRLELIEYYKSHQSDSITNRFQNQAHLILLDVLNQQIVVKNTISSTFDMKVLTLADSTLAIGIIRTVCAPVCQSSIEFYDTVWNRIQLKFTMPKAFEWINEKSIPVEKLDVKWVRNIMNISFVSLKFSSDNQIIKATNNTLEFLSEADRKTILPYILINPIIFRLKGRQWDKMP
jgi:hypothetical protein